MQAPFLGKCHVVLSMEHWLVMMATKSIDHSNFFLFRFLPKQRIISAEFFPEKGVTLLIKENGRRAAAIMDMKFLSFAHAFVYLPLSDKESYRRLK